LGTDCTVISGTRLTPSKSFASVLASSVRLGLARCEKTTSVVVPGARITPNMSLAGVPASSTRSTADEVPPPAWPRLPCLLLLWRGGWRGKPGCCSSATGGRRRRVRPGGPSTGSTSEFYRCVPLPRWVAARWNTRGKCGLYYLAPRVARSRGYKRSRERERESEPVRLLVPPRDPPAGRP
jgi:hypothetical protein